MASVRAAVGIAETAPPVLASVYNALKAEHIALLARYNALNEAHKELQAKTPDAKPVYEYAEGECRPVIAARGNRCALPYFYHHANHHAKFYCRASYRGYGSTLVGRIVWALGTGLAICSGHQIALAGTSDVCDHPIGGRL